MAGVRNAPSGREKRTGSQGPALLPPEAGPMRKAGTIPETGFPKRESLPANPVLSPLPSPGNLIGKRHSKNLTDSPPPEEVAPRKTPGIAPENDPQTTGSRPPIAPPKDPSLPETHSGEGPPGVPTDSPPPEEVAPGKTPGIAHKNDRRATGSRPPTAPPKDPSLPETLSGGGPRIAGKNPVQSKARRNGRKNAPPKILPALRKPGKSPVPKALEEDAFRHAPKIPDRRIW